MSSGQAAAYDDAEEYKELCRILKEKVRYSNYVVVWPYNIDHEHYYDLKKRYRESNEKI